MNQYPGFVRDIMKGIPGILMIVALVTTTGCFNMNKPKPRVPLRLTASASADAVAHNDQGIKAYMASRLEDAKQEFETVVRSEPESAQGHYNLGLTLFTMGQVQESREHFMQAANLAPGDKVIWDSPVLRPYSSPEPSIATSKKEVKVPRGGGLGRGGMSGGSGF